MWTDPDSTRSEALQSRFVMAETQYARALTAQSSLSMSQSVRRVPVTLAFLKFVDSPRGDNALIAWGGRRGHASHTFT